MAYLYRVTRSAFLFALFVFSGLSSAVAPTYNFTMNGISGTFASTSAMCSAWASFSSSGFPTYAPFTCFSAPVGVLAGVAMDTPLTIKDKFGASYNGTTFAHNICPGSFTFSAGACVCPAGQSEVGGVCTGTTACSTMAGFSLPEANATSKIGAATSAQITGIIQSGTHSFCDSTGCLATGKPTFGGVFGGQGSITISGAKFTGATCDPNAAAGAATPQDSTVCKAGTCPGTINGVESCQPCSTGVTADTSTGSTTTSTTGGTTTSVTGTTSSVTTCDGTSCTTTSIITNVPSSGTGSATTATTSETEPLANFCKDNPTSPFCKAAESSKYSGAACGAVPACDGDAIQCAIALESFKTSCALSPAASAESGLYDSSKGVTSAGLTTTAVVISSGSFSSAAVLGGGACIGDKTVVVAGKTIVLPFSDVCPSLGYLKAVLLAVSYLVAASIVFRGGVA